MIRALAAILLAAACGGDDTMAMRPPPSGPVFTSKAAQRIERGRQDAARFGAYAPSVFVRPATMDAAVAALSTSFTNYTPPALLRLKGVDRAETFTGAEVLVAVAVAPNPVTVCVVLCEYTEDGGGVTISEIARSIVEHRLTTTDPGIVTAEFPVPVTLDPNKKYAMGVSYFAAGGAGATLVGASSSAGVAAIRFPMFSFGTLNTRIDVRWDGVNNAQVEWVERGAGNIYDRPLVTMVGPSPTARWY